MCFVHTGTELSGRVSQVPLPWELRELSELFWEPMGGAAPARGAGGVGTSFTFYPVYSTLCILFYPIILPCVY